MKPSTQIEIVYPPDLLVCDTCNGDGYEDIVEDCDECSDGSGAAGDRDCPACHGNAEVNTSDDCSSCNGYGEHPVPPVAARFIEKLTPVMQAIADAGIGVTVPTGSGNECCGSCIASAAVPGVRGSWIGFHDQSLESVAAHRRMYVSHTLPDAGDRQMVLDTLATVGTVSWNGSDHSAIRIGL